MATCAAVGVMLSALGCNSFKNGWLDPTILGDFEASRSLDIRSSLSLDDTPPGIAGAAYPLPEDHDVEYIEYPIAPGDTLGIEINELRQREFPFQAQALVSATGVVNLPVVGRIQAAGLTVHEFEDRLVDSLQTRDILRDPEVTVNPIFLQNATYSIFGIGVSASTNAPLRAGTFPIRRPDLRVLEAINQVGGLSEFVTDIYVFRADKPAWTRNGQASLGAASETSTVTRESQRNGDAATTSPQERELIEAVTGGNAEATAVQDSAAETALEQFRPDSIDPYIWVNGEFVANPEHQGGAVAQPSMPSAPFETITPGVNWARLAGDMSQRVIHIPAMHLREGNPEVNIVIRAGDVIRIVSGEIGVYYVMGQVNRVGTFAFNAEAITLKAAIAAAGGLSGLAWPDRCTIYRRLGEREQMIQVNLDRIFAAKDADFLIRRGDIINVGTHPFAPFLRRIRALTLPNPVANVGYGFTYTRNFADVDSFAIQPNPSQTNNRFLGLFNNAVDRQLQNIVFPALLNSIGP